MPGSFGERIGSVEKALTGSGRVVTDWTSKIQGAVSGVSSLQGTLGRLKTTQGELTSQIQKQKAEMEQSVFSTSKQTEALAKLEAQLKSVNRNMIIGKGLDKFAAGFDKAAKSALGLGASIIKLGLDGLFAGIRRVYDLQLKWAKLQGEFNMKLGGASKNIGGMRKAANQWEGTMRGLTDGFGEGTAMMGEYIESFGLAIDENHKYNKVAIQMSRGMNIGNAASGQLLRTFDNMNVSGNEASVAMAMVNDAADAAGVPVNLLAKEFAGANDYMARFGKQGMKTFITGAAYARKFGISVKELQGAFEKFDNFDQAAESVSKLNAMFGTTINSMDMMLNNDVGARFETVRKGLLAQGKTSESMSAIQIRTLSKTLDLTESQIQTMLSQKNVGISYMDFKKKQLAAEKKDADAKATMQKTLQSTVQIMHAFGVSFDKITVAIGKAIRPFLEVLGLAKSTEKGMKGFNGTMVSVTDTVVKFFENLAKNEKWMGFMRKLAYDALAAAKALAAFVGGGGIQKLISKVVPVFEKLYDVTKGVFGWLVDNHSKISSVFEMVFKHVDKIGLAVAGLRAVVGVGGLLTNAYSGAKGAVGTAKDLVTGGVESSGGGGGKFGGYEAKKKKGGVRGWGGSSRGARIAGGGAALAAAAFNVATADNKKEAAVAGIGSLAGGAIGSIFGPLGTAIGSALGGQLAPAIYSAYTGPNSPSVSDADTMILKESQVKLDKAKLKRDKMLAAVDNQRSVASASLNASMEVQLAEQEKIRQQAIANSDGSKKAIAAANAAYATNESTIRQNTAALQGQLEAVQAASNQKFALDDALNNLDRKKLEMDKLNIERLYGPEAQKRASAKQDKFDVVRGQKFAYSDRQKMEGEYKVKLAAINNRESTLLNKETEIADKKWKLEAAGIEKIQVMKELKENAEFQAYRALSPQQTEEQAMRAFMIAGGGDVYGKRYFAAEKSLADAGVTAPASPQAGGAPAPAPRKAASKNDKRDNSQSNVFVYLDGKQINVSAFAKKGELH
jgi:hypothetical protein